MSGNARTIRAGVSSLLHALGLKRLVLAGTVYNPLVVAWKSMMLRRRYADIRIGILLWPPARPLWETIEAELARDGDIVDARDVPIASDHFRNFVEDVYAIDTTRSPKADNKYRYLLADDLTVRLVLLRIDRPHVFTKDIFTTMIWCREIKEIKDRVRAHHRDSVPNYTYDNIIHSTDNDLQTQQLLACVETYAATPERRSVG
jgi:hypothetical protein